MSDLIWKYFTALALGVMLPRMLGAMSIYFEIEAAAARQAPRMTVQGVLTRTRVPSVKTLPATCLRANGVFVRQSLTFDLQNRADAKHVTSLKGTGVADTF